MSSSIRFILNDREIHTSLPPGTVVLDFLRNEQRLTGTKEGCREGDCGACMVLLGELNGREVKYRAVNSCLLPLGDIAVKHLVSIEGLNRFDQSGPPLNPIQQTIVDQGAVQCGFCTPGFVISLTNFFLSSGAFRVEDVVDSVAGNLCRCTGYSSLRRAIACLIEDYAEKLSASSDRIRALVALKILPDYFAGIPGRLQKLRGAAAVRGNSRPGCLVAGGTDLFVQKPEQLAELKDFEIEFISSRSGLAGVRVKGGRCRIGAATPIEDLLYSAPLRKVFPDFSNYMRSVASAPIRRRATVGGNIANASPVGDMIIILLALEAVLILKHGEGRRELSLRDFFKAYKRLDLREAELLEGVTFQLPGEDSYFNFEKVSRRKHLDIASVNSAAQIFTGQGLIRAAHLSAGGVAPVPLYLKQASAYLAGKRINAAHIREAARLAGQEISPINDVRGSAEYKSLLLRQLLFAHFITLFPEQVKGEDLLC